MKKKIYIVSLSVKLKTTTTKELKNLHFINGLRTNQEWFSRMIIHSANKEKCRPLCPGIEVKYNLKLPLMHAELIQFNAEEPQKQTFLASCNLRTKQRRILIDKMLVFNVRMCNVPTDCQPFGRLLTA